MKRLLFTLAFILLSISCFADNRIRSVEVTARLDSLGGAAITERWHVDVKTGISEWYLAHDNTGEGKIHDLTVRDILSGEEYQTLDLWRVDWSRNEKARKCGIVLKSGNDCELCWGVTSNGEHLWEVKYQYDNLMTAFADSCAFNHMFISDDLGVRVEKAKVTIVYPERAITDSIASIWAFGFGGIVSFENGTIVADASSGLSTDQSIIVMATFDKSLFHPSVTNEGNFSVMKDRALEGSNYSSGEKMGFWESLGVGVVVCIAILFCIVLYYAMQIIFAAGLMFTFSAIIPILWGVITLYPIRMFFRRRRYMGGKTWHKTTPDDKDLSKVPYVMSKLSYNILSKSKYWDNDLTAAYIMRIIFLGGFFIEKQMDDNGKMKAMLRVRKQWHLNEGLYSRRDTDAMRELYQIIKAASGADLTLQKKEIKQFKKKQGQEMIKSFYAKRVIDDFKLEKTDVQQIMGFKKYLDDFTLTDQREIPEVGLWDEYLVYATVFGNADKVMKSMKKVAPDYFKLENRSQLLDGMGGFVVTNDILRCVSHEVNSLHNYTVRKDNYSGSSGGGYTSRSSGGGGFSSYGGGGGHSGGGGGGGR